MWHNPMDNPHDQYVNYKLLKGARFIEVSNWLDREGHQINVPEEPLDDNDIAKF